MSSRILIDPHNQVKPLPPHPDCLTLPDNQTTRPLDHQSIGIDEVRDLIRWAHRKPFQKPEKRVLIRQAQHLTEEAQNALLKILEEPPQGTQITLSVSHIDHLLPTVKSRCTIVSAAARKTEKLPREQDMKHPMFHVALPSSIRDAFSRAAKLAQLDRREIIKELDQLILQLRGDPAQPKPRNGLTKHWKSIKTITVAQQQIRENVNVKLVLENMFLKILLKNPKH